jgi:hypothetical protein
MIDIAIVGGIAAAYKVLAAKAVVAGTAKVAEVGGAHALANGAAAALPHVFYGGTISHAIGASTLGVTGSVAHGAGGAWGAAAVGGGSGAYVLYEFAKRERKQLEELIGKPAAGLLWDSFGDGTFGWSLQQCEHSGLPAFSDFPTWLSRGWLL